MPRPLASVLARWRDLFSFRITYLAYGGPSFILRTLAFYWSARCYVLMRFAGLFRNAQCHRNRPQSFDFVNKLFFNYSFENLWGCSHLKFRTWFLFRNGVIACCSVQAASKILDKLHLLYGIYMQMQPFFTIERFSGKATMWPIYLQYTIFRRIRTRLVWFCI